MKLSIIVMAYNIGKYLAQALDSVFMQKTNFDYEVIIAEDCSTDNTKEIIREYASKFSKIKVLYSPKNRGCAKNFANAFMHAQGEYFTVLDGDDYWTDPNKLQKHIDFLDKNLSFVGCGHNTLFLDEMSHEKPAVKPIIDEEPELDEFTLQDFLDDKMHYVHTSATTFRNIFKEKVPKVFFDDFADGDTPRLLVHIKHGKFKYFHELGSVYRIHSGGIWSGVDEFNKAERSFRVFLLADSATKYSHHSSFMRKAKVYRNKMIEIIKNKYKKKDFRTCLII